MHLLKQYEQTAVYDPNDPNQERRIFYAGGVGYNTAYFNRVPVESTLKGVGLSGWSTLPAAAQIAIVLAGSTAVGFFAMKKFGSSHIKPALRKVGINLSGPRVRRHRKR